jgi:hypothetical protein
LKYSSSFTHDLEFGETGEDFINDIFTSGKKIEVKTDRIAHKTGNIFIEYYSRNKPSGISTTDANYWVYIIEGCNISLILEVESLKEKLRGFFADGKYLKNGGDNDSSKGFLIPIVELFKKI